MRTIQAKKNDKACIVTDANGNGYFRLGSQTAVEPILSYPSRNVVQVASIEDVEFTDDEDVKVEESVYCQDFDMIIFDSFVGPRPKNIVRRK